MLALEPEQDQRPVSRTPEAGDALARTETAISRRIAGLVHTMKPGRVPHASASLAETYLALAAVQAAKARDYLALPRPDRNSAHKCIVLADELLAARDPKAPPRIVRHGLLLEHAYFSRNDRSPQPYFIYVPTGCTPGRDWPMIMFLHGWVPETSRTDPFLVTDDVLRLAEEYRTIFVIPHGRTNTDFQYAGEVDVLRVKQEVERFYEVDSDKVYLLGISMGGA